MENRNFYEILGVRETASFEEIAAAKNALAKKYHPDVNLRKGIDTTHQMQEILEAYSTLSDEKKRKEYDRELRGTTSVMQTFDLSKMQEEQNVVEDGFVIYWKTAGKLYDIIMESEPLFRQKKQEATLSALASKALKYIFVLRNAKIPERYWHPDIMNWLLFQSYKNRNYTTEYLLSLYDDHLKNNCSMRNKIKYQKKSNTYIHAIKKLLKY